MGPGSVVGGRFEIERLAGSGGMGAVYRARDRRSGGLVALKVLHGHRPEHGERFAREARLLAELSHPGIVGFVESSTTATGEGYLVMEWLDGESLSARLARGPLAVVETVALGRSVASALAVAHRRGVVHRDIKPSNLFLPGGSLPRVTVLDFGIAGVQEAGEPLTVTGAVLGTPGYMAPEQVRGERGVDARADVFALGAVLFRCLTGRAAFPGSEALPAMLEVLTSPAPLASSVRPDVPPALEDLIDRMLAKRPEDRPRDAAAVDVELAAIEAGETGEAVHTHTLTEATAHGRRAPPSARAMAAALDGTGEATLGAAPPADTVRPTKVRPWRPRSPSPPGSEVAAARSRRLRSRGLVAALALAIGCAGWVALKAPIVERARGARAGSSSALDPTVEGVVDAGVERTCRAWGRAIAARQHADGGFSGIRQAPPSGWDTAQQLYALLSAERACGGVLDARTRLSALQFLQAARREHGWVGAPTHAGVVQASTVATAWAALAFTGAGDGAAAADARDLLIRDQHADGGFALGAGPSAAPESAGYATVMGLWALTAVAEAFPTTEAADAARRAAHAWVRRALTATPGQDASLRGVAGLTEQATWVLWRARPAEDAALAAPLAREILERCAPLVTARFACTYDPNGDGTVELRLRADAAPIRISTFWFPWAALSSAALAADAGAAFEGATRAQLASLSRWASSRVAASSELEMLEAYQLSESLFAASALLSARRGPGADGAVGGGPVATGQRAPTSSRPTNPR